MLRFFRTIRRKLFSEGKVANYFGYAIGEILLIVVGILLALQISEWNQNRKDRSEETQILLRLKADFEDNQEKLKIWREQNEEVSTGVRTLLEMIEPEPTSYADDEIRNYMAKVGWNPTYIPNTGTINSLLSSGKIALISNDSLNHRLNTWPSIMEEYTNLMDYMKGGYLAQWDTYLENYRFREMQIVDGDNNHTGPSKFSYDQRALLSDPKLEDLAEQKRLSIDQMLAIVDKLQKIQQEILDLIEEDLSQRGI